METTINLSRHVEKALITNVLTEKGHAQAKSLAAVLGDTKITAIYSPDLVCNLDTARPLAKHVKIDITTVSSKSYPSDVVTKMLTEHSGGVVLWVGNTSNLSDIYSQLGGEGEEPNNYGNLIFMKIKDQGPPEIIKTTYGP